MAKTAAPTAKLEKKVATWIKKGDADEFEVRIQRRRDITDPSTNEFIYTQVTAEFIAPSHVATMQININPCAEGEGSEETRWVVDEASVKVEAPALFLVFPGNGSKTLQEAVTVEKFIAEKDSVWFRAACRITEDEQLDSGH